MPCQRALRDGNRRDSCSSFLINFVLFLVNLFLVNYGSSTSLTSSRILLIEHSKNILVSLKSHALSSSCNIDHFVVQLILRLRHSSSRVTWWLIRVCRVEDVKWKWKLWWIDHSSSRETCVRRERSNNESTSECNKRLTHRERHHHLELRRPSSPEEWCERCGLTVSPETGWRRRQA